jgi:hypothetical protein
MRDNDRARQNTATLGRSRRSSKQKLLETRECVVSSWMRAAEVRGAQGEEVAIASRDPKSLIIVAPFGFEPVLQSVVGKSHANRMTSQLCRRPRCQYKAR